MSDTLLASLGAVKDRVNATYPSVSAQGLELMCGTGFHESHRPAIGDTQTSSIAPSVADLMLLNGTYNAAVKKALCQPFC